MPYERPKNSGIWYSCLRINGVVVRKRLKGVTNEKTANAIESKWRSESLDGKYFDADKLKPIKFKDFVRIPENPGEVGGPYYENHLKHKKSFNTGIQYTVKKLCRFFGEYYLHEISFSLCSEYQKLNCKEFPVGTNRGLNLISNIFKHAIFLNAREKKWKVPTYNPAQGVRREPESARKVVYKPEELKRLLNIAKESRRETLYDMILLSLLTGMRVGELQKLKKKHVDFVNNVIILTENKTKSLAISKGYANSGGMDQVVAMCKTAKDIMAKYVGLPADQPFKESPKKAFNSAREKAGIQHGVFHDLRRTFATYLGSLRVPKHTIKELLRHAIDKDDVSAIYLLVLPPELHEAVQRLEKFLIECGVIETENVHRFVHQAQPESTSFNQTETVVNR